jgi:hypothetical protein
MKWGANLDEQEIIHVINIYVDDHNGGSVFKGE